MRRRRRIPIRAPVPRAAWLLGGALLSAFVVAPSGSAHVRLEPDQIRAGSTGGLTVLAPSEHDAPMVEVKITLPHGSQVLDARNVGWRTTVDASTVRWSRRRARADASESFSLVVRAPEAGGEHRLVATQRYGDGYLSRWQLSFTVSRGPGQNLLAAAIVGLVGVPLVFAFVLVRARVRASEKA